MMLRASLSVSLFVDWPLMLWTMSPGRTPNASALLPAFTCNITNHDYQFIEFTLTHFFRVFLLRHCVFLFLSKGNACRCWNQNGVLFSQTHKLHSEWVSEWVSGGLTFHSTLYRSLRSRFFQTRWPDQQRQSTEGSQLATGVGFNLTLATPPYYNMNCRQRPLG